MLFEQGISEINSRVLCCEGCFGARGPKTHRQMPRERNANSEEPQNDVPGSKAMDFSPRSEMKSEHLEPAKAQQCAASFSSKTPEGP